MAVVVGVAVLVVVRLLARISGARPLDSPDGNPDGAALVPLVLTAAGAILADASRPALRPGRAVLTSSRVPVEPVALLLGDPRDRWSPRSSSTARDARRFVLGAVVAMVAWFVVVYPNISALPLPTAIVNVYQGVLPTLPVRVPVPGQQPLAASVPIHLVRAGPADARGGDGLPVPRRRLLGLGLAAGAGRAERTTATGSSWAAAGGALIARACRRGRADGRAPGAGASAVSLRAERRGQARP